MTKLCGTCKVTKDTLEFSPKPNAKDGLWPECKDCARHRAKMGARTRRAANPDLERIRRKMGRYGLGPEHYDAMFVAQDGKCAICERTGSGASHYEELCVDHDHRTGKVRGLLCANCNSGIGLLADDAERLVRAMSYLVSHQVMSREKAIEVAFTLEVREPVF